MDFEQPGNNPSGTIVLNAKDVAKDGHILNVIHIMYQVFDLEDYHDKKYSAFMLKDGTGLKLMVPTTPKWMWNNVGLIYGLETNPCQQTQNAHTAAGLSIKEDISTQTKDIILHFPSGVKCCAEFYNFKSDKLKMKNYFRWLEKKCNVGLDATLDQNIPFIVWKFVVNEENKRLLQPIVEDEEGIKQAVQRMSTMHVSKTED